MITLLTGRVASYQEALRLLQKTIVLGFPVWCFSVSQSNTYSEPRLKDSNHGLWCVLPCGEAVAARLLPPSPTLALLEHQLTHFSVPVAGAIAGATAAAAYVDAKFHITKDIKGIRGQKATARALEKNCTSNQPTCSHCSPLILLQHKEKANPSGTNSKPKSAVSPRPKSASGRAPAAIPGLKPTRTHAATASTSARMASCPGSCLPCT